MDHNQQGGGQGGRRHFHRGRRGQDRRGPERRHNAPQQDQPQHRGTGEHVDVEQIMRDIRARIAQRHGIELSNQQIQELAARRLEAILDPRTVKPALLDQLRKSAGTPRGASLPEAPPQVAYTFEDWTIFESKSGLLRFIRNLLKPILKLFFNPNPLIHALNTQVKINAEAAAREAERDRQQAEWNALHYELLQRVVTEAARNSIELQALAMKVESLAARVDFNDRRVRSMESVPHQPQPQRQPRPVEHAAPAPAAPAEGQPATVQAAPGEAVPATPDGQRRRRRRRRGRRGGGVPGEMAAAIPGAVAGATEIDGSDLDDGEGPDDESMEAAGDEIGQPAEALAPAAEARVEATEPPPAPPASPAVPDAIEHPSEQPPAATPEPPAEGGVED